MVKKTGRPRPTRADDDENDAENDDELADISGPTRPTRPGMEYAVRGANAHTPSL